MKLKLNVALHTAATVLLMLSSLAAIARDFEFQRDCKQWLDKKGYSVDYIMLKTGKRQPGMATKWLGNVDRMDVQVGDVVTTRLQDRGDALRAAYVEEVRRNADGSPGAVLVSEWNLGATPTSAVSSPTNSAS
jgi:hypothetical protein